MTTTQEMICGINAVEGFDPMELAVEYDDLGAGEKRKRLPVMAQMAWFRLKYPEGRVAVAVQPARDFFVATARVYRSYNDPPDCFLAEATASRGKLEDKPTISPREWAQTAAVGIALRYAGFGLQFHAAGEGFDSPAVNELGDGNELAVRPELVRQPPEPEPMTYNKAITLPCPIKRYSGKTLGDLITLEPNALVWLSQKGSGETQEAAKLICEQAERMAA